MNKDIFPVNEIANQAYLKFEKEYRGNDSEVKFELDLIYDDNGTFYKFHGDFTVQFELIDTNWIDDEGRIIYKRIIHDIDATFDSIRDMRNNVILCEIPIDEIYKKLEYYLIG
jgi:hypothetical protein